MANVLVVANANVEGYTAGTFGVRDAADPLIAAEWFTVVDESGYTRAQLDEVAQTVGLNPADYDTKSDVLGAITEAVAAPVVAGESLDATPGTLAADDVPPLA